MKSSVQHGRLQEEAISQRRLTKQRLIYDSRIKSTKYRVFGYLRFQVSRGMEDRESVIETPTTKTEAKRQRVRSVLEGKVNDHPRQ